ncbi:MAG TPA: hypothetical protein VF041_03980, partial [Gemmatimonadaceae bacterium]
QVYDGFPGTHLTVDVHVKSIAHGDDSVRVTYVVDNQPASEERVFTLTVEAPAPATHLSIPEPRAGWNVSTRYVDRSVASWAALDDTMGTPGRSTPPLSFTAFGLPGIVDAHVQGWAEPPDIDAMADDDPRLTKDALEVASVPLKVVGVVPALPHPTRAVLIARLVDLARQTCDLGWTTNPHVCASLDAYLRAPSPRLLGFLRAVSETRARPGVLNDNAYWLLRSNAEIARDFVDVASIRLTYVCDNSYRVGNSNYVPVTVRYQVDGTGEGGSITVPGRSSDEGAAPEASLTTRGVGMVRLLLGGRVIQTAANGGTACQH